MQDAILTSIHSTISYLNGVSVQPTLSDSERQSVNAHIKSLIAVTNALKTKLEAAEKMAEACLEILGKSHSRIGVGYEMQQIAKEALQNWMAKPDSGKVGGGG